MKLTSFLSKRKVTTSLSRPVSLGCLGDENQTFQQASSPERFLVFSLSSILSEAAGDPRNTLS